MLVGRKSVGGGALLLATKQSICLTMFVRPGVLGSLRTWKSVCSQDTFTGCLDKRQESCPGRGPFLDPQTFCECSHSGDAFSRSRTNAQPMAAFVLGPVKVHGVNVCGGGPFLSR
jgi:hypothetical protein